MTGPRWYQILEHWPAIEHDLHDRYGFDAGAPGALQSRSWRWLRGRIVDLLDQPPIVTPTGRIIPATRLDRALNPPDQSGR